jgi:hypothetical protein
MALLDNITRQTKVENPSRTSNTPQRLDKFPMINIPQHPKLPKVTIKTDLKP